MNISDLCVDKKIKSSFIFFKLNFLKMRIENEFEIKISFHLGFYPSIFDLVARLYCVTRSTIFTFFFSEYFFSTTSDPNKNKMKRALVSLVRQRVLANGAESAKVNILFQILQCPILFRFFLSDSISLTVMFWLVRMVD